ncbi:hypothetical protein GCM10009841_01470 [Microlunatus panaciterrae]|uniref:Secretion/DNA translocation related TadE-like protein n=1 Tax=Microlunatus panaciterrae TaxID=400768 RepID=A0ABS2RJN9_9ACTN|nr:Rv3654c family TadE-like protein [Microlunatus panaciterrae]MBM7799229.1 secretion/DNA translocation related TadE-like protein [Microlunatus panaciterrae]
MKAIGARGRSWGLRRSERGSGTVLVLGLTAVTVMLSFAALCIAGYLVAAHRAKAAADLGALAAAGAVATGADACSAARVSVAQNRARVGDCAVVGDRQDFVVSLTAVVTLRAIVPGLPTAVTAKAYAGSAPS